MKRLFFVISLFLFTLFAYAQSRDPKGIGSAKELTGNTYILEVFISDQNNNWLYEEKLDIINKYYEAINWIQNQSRRYNINVNFEGGNFGLDSDIKINNIEYGTASGNENIDMVSTVLKKIGYENSLSFYNWAINNNFDNTFVLIFVKGMGTGYAIAYDTDIMNKDLYYLEGAILYEKYLNGQELASSSIAHEMLHIYGAWDLYATFQQSREIEQLAKIYFPNSIMHRVSYNINELDIDSLTAWRIGWNINPELWYYNFNPLH